MIICSTLHTGKAKESIVYACISVALCTVIKSMCSSLFFFEFRNTRQCHRGRAEGYPLLPRTRPDQPFLNNDGFSTCSERVFDTFCLYKQYRWCWSCPPSSWTRSSSTSGICHPDTSFKRYKARQEVRSRAFGASSQECSMLT